MPPKKSKKKKEVKAEDSPQDEEEEEEEEEEKEEEAEEHRSEFSESAFDDVPLGYDEKQEIIDCSIVQKMGSSMEKAKLLATLCKEYQIKTNSKAYEWVRYLLRSLDFQKKRGLPLHYLLRRDKDGSTIKRSVRSKCSMPTETPTPAHTEQPDPAVVEENPNGEDDEEEEKLPATDSEPPSTGVPAPAIPPPNSGEPMRGYRGRFGRLLLWPSRRPRVESLHSSSSRTGTQTNSSTLLRKLLCEPL